MNLSLPQVSEEKKHYVPTSTNQAYGYVEQARDTEFEVHGVQSEPGATMTTPEPIYEAVY